MVYYVHFPLVDVLKGLFWSDTACSLKSEAFPTIVTLQAELQSQEYCGRACMVSAPLF